MTVVDRRRFLRRIAAYGSGAVFAPSLAGLAAFNDATTTAVEPSLAKGGAPRAGKGLGGYGPLVPSTDCPELLIPEGFRCARLSEIGAVSTANPGFIVPTALDGMAAFPLANGNVRLIRNHEIRDSAAAGPVLGGAANAYDPKAGGGTTSLEVRIGRSGQDIEVELLAEFVSLAGTYVNCAGGPTPWGSWLTCEETIVGETQGFAKNHGYVFEVPATATSPVDAVPLRALGRFVHEAVAIDPQTGFLFETEDIRFDRANTEQLPGSGFYRFIPAQPGNLRAGGKLQMLAIKGRPNYDTTEGQRPGLILPVEWVDIEDPDSDAAETDPNYVFKQGLAQGGAIFQRLEGCWYGDGSVFFNSTSGGDAGAGQVWQYRPRGSRQGQLNGSGGQLILVFESPGEAVLDSPDNITVSPRGGGLVLCEDGIGVQFIRGLTQRGQIFDLVQTNAAAAVYGGREPTEFAGACFSPGGEVLFFNEQGETRTNRTPRFGATYALWGPWEVGTL